MARQDPIWDRMPADYFEGPFVGNGLLGAILFKDDQKPNTLRFEIGRTDVYDHRSSMEKPMSNYASGRLPIGQLLLTPVGEIQEVHLRTDLWNAEVYGELKTSEGTLHFRCFVPCGEEFILLELKGEGKEISASISFRPEQGNHPRPQLQQKQEMVYIPNPPFTVEKKEEMEVITQPLLVGDDYATAWSDDLQSDGSRIVRVSVANRWGKMLTPATGSASDAIATLQRARQQSLSALEEKHREWWHHFYSASFVSLPDSRLESFYWIQLYKLASATRVDCPAIDLMGPWFRKSVWAAYWTNLNIQLAYYTTGITNHLELGEPLYRLMKRHTDQLIQNVPVEFRNDCAALSNPVGYDSLTAPVRLSTDPQKRLSLIALPWLVQMNYIHNRMEMNDEELRTSLYPLMKRTFNVYLRVMTLGEEGKYHIPLTYSDEYGEAPETSLNIALAEWGFRTLIECANRLNIDDPLLPAWKEHLEKMQGYAVDENGIMIGKGVPLDKPHRHYSHLFGIFPFYTFNIERNSDQIELMKKSVQHYIGLNGDSCMYKFNGAASLYAALGEGNQALRWLNRSLEILPRTEPTVGPNTLYSEHGFETFESPIASSRSILDMLIQGWGGTIRVFPACPDSWTDVAFHDLRAEGGFLVSAVRKNGKTFSVRVKSLAGEPCRVSIDGKIEILKLSKDEEIVLGEKNLVIQPIISTDQPQNPWGLH
ncbi:MAG: alpha-L-fucosidase [Verrucomicrobiota bacterium]